MADYSGVSKEETLKARIFADFFDKSKYSYKPNIDNIDFIVASAENTLLEYHYLWAEAKTGNHDICAMFAQLVLTIGKARAFDKILPPPFLGCFDGKKIAFISYSETQNIFYQNDFNWKVTPSNTETKEFRQVYDQIKKIIDADTMIFDFARDEQELHQFIKQNFIIGKNETARIKIDKNNFIIIYNKWLQTVKPTIQVDWDLAKKSGIIDGDFYLADLLSLENKTIKDKLSVILKQDQYELDKHKNEAGLFTSSHVEFNDNQIAHTQFWNRYERPPHKDYWDYIIERRDLLVPQDVRERKGSFFTPQIWVELSQKYIADVFGENWQDEYYVWDCAAGTGNLLAGLTNKDRIWASTLDKQDVDVMRDRISNGANLWKEQVFQFDFLNDEFLPQSKGGKLPDELYKIINDKEKRKKLIIYINPPYAEATTATTVTGTGENKAGVAILHKTKEKYKISIGKASNEIFAHFLAKIYCEMPFSTIANFSTLKSLQSSNFSDFRSFFRAKLEKIFLVPANTFDNVKGQFPIGFFIWNTRKEETFEQITADVYAGNGNFVKTKKIFGNLPQSINRWIKLFDNQKENIIGHMENPTPDFQNNKFLCVINNEGTRHNNYYAFCQNNLIEGCIYFSVRYCIVADWLNDRDQFLYPNDGYKTDLEFQNDCLAFTLFHGQNRISANEGTNHWIPFTEEEVGSQHKFDSHFMTDFIAGKIKASQTLFAADIKRDSPLKFSAEAKEVFDAGRELWRYYHQQKNLNPNASFYDIREHFQKRNEKGTMKTKSDDETYNGLIADLREKLKILARKIEPKVYEYGFLK
ncbi:MAG: hypothetical protein LBQ52_07030 [Helicobacteraceae bacterium]|jgi:hypothetical protein|nr:hypothetical protein [Helicobacteraceae bacterium]